MRLVIRYQYGEGSNLMSEVAIVFCGSYAYPEVREAVERGFALLGGTEKFARPNEKILLKLNWLSADPPEKCVTTHPSIFRAVAELLQREGAAVSYGDSPGFQTPDVAAKRTGARGCGIAENSPRGLSIRPGSAFCRRPTE